MTYTENLPSEITLRGAKRAVYTTLYPADADHDAILRRMTEIDSDPFPHTFHVDGYMIQAWNLAQARRIARYMISCGMYPRNLSGV